MRSWIGNLGLSTGHVDSFSSNKMYKEKADSQGKEQEMNSHIGLFSFEIFYILHSKPVKLISGFL